MSMAVAVRGDRAPLDAGLVAVRVPVDLAPLDGPGRALRDEHAGGGDRRGSSEVRHLPEPEHPLPFGCDETSDPRWLPTGTIERILWRTGSAAV
jgi:hypothetical protein